MPHSSSRFAWTTARRTQLLASLLLRGRSSSTVSARCCTALAAGHRRNAPAAARSHIVFPCCDPLSFSSDRY
jgi:hypothetical protein